MPLYEYRCAACGKLTEKRQKFSDPEITECPHCGGVLERTITAPAVQFKGSGWYADLYSSAKKPEGNAGAESGTSTDAAKPGEAAHSGGAAKSETGGAKTESAPAAAPASTGTSAPAPSSTPASSAPSK